LLCAALPTHQIELGQTIQARVMAGFDMLSFKPAFARFSPFASPADAGELRADYQFRSRRWLTHRDSICPPSDSQR
jgi:hypothetical protein